MDNFYHFYITIINFESRFLRLLRLLNDSNGTQKAVFNDSNVYKRKKKASSIGETIYAKKFIT